MVFGFVINSNAQTTVLISNTTDMDMVVSVEIMHKGTCNQVGYVQDLLVPANTAVNATVTCFVSPCPNKSEVEVGWTQAVPACGSGGFIKKAVKSSTNCSLGSQTGFATDPGCAVILRSFGIFINSTMEIEIG